MSISGASKLFRYAFLVVSSLLSLSSVAAPPANLSQSDLYSDFANKVIAAKYRTYSPQYPLWSDGAEKSRYIYIPEGQKINTASKDRWVFPVGTKVWKEFKFKTDGRSRRIETRLIEKIQPAQIAYWKYYVYIWNDDETEAVLDAAGLGKENVFPTGPNTSHDIPKRADCTTCHNQGGDPVLGFSALQLSWDRDPLAVHAEPIPEGGVTLQDLQTLGLVTHPVEYPPILNASDALTRAAMGYLHSNCGSCHNPTGTAGYTELHFGHPLEGTSPVLATALNQRNRYFTALTYRIEGGSPERSSLIARMKVEGHEYPKMPAIGAERIDALAVEQLSQWVRGLPAPPPTRR